MIVAILGGFLQIYITYNTFLSYTGISIPLEANVIVAILVVPLNSALNPFLYTLNVVRDKMAAREETRLSHTVEKQLAAQYIEAWIKDGTLSLSDFDM